MSITNVISISELVLWSELHTFGSYRLLYKVSNADSEGNVRLGLPRALPPQAVHPTGQPRTSLCHRVPGSSAAQPGKRALKASAEERMPQRRALQILTPCHLSSVLKPYSPCQVSP